MVDTAFVARLGEVPLAALGVGTSALSSVFWIFNFLGISAQTGIAQADGRNDGQTAVKTVSLALSLAMAFGLALILIVFPLVPALASLLGADAVIGEVAVRYMRVRLFGAPAVLITLTAFGALRGRQDMRSPLWIAVTVNLLNIVLDYPFIFGLGPIPALDVTGAALASTFSQYVGATAALWVVRQRFGFVRGFDWSAARALIVVGGDLFVRTGMLTVVIIIGTRVATQGGAAAGAAHQAIRTFFLFTALLLDAFAITAQSLVGFFMGSRQVVDAKRVVRIALFWATGASVLMFLGMIFGRTQIEALLVPENARTIFRTAWIIAASTQIIGAVSFVTDGVHWGTGDFRYLRNVMIAASVVAIGAMLMIDPSSSNVLLYVWLSMALWNAIRAVFGFARIWPGMGQSPFTELVN